MITLRSRVIVAGPTTGKSYLMNNNTTKFRFLDTDDITQVMFPEWFDAHLWSKAPTPSNNLSFARKCMHSAIALMCSSALHHVSNKDVVLITNIWTKDFLHYLGPDIAPDGKSSVFVFRDSAADIHDMSVSGVLESGRNDVISIKQADEWVTSAKKFGSKVADQTVFLKPGEFLSDVLEISHLPKLSYSLKGPGVYLRDIEGLIK